MVNVPRLTTEELINAKSEAEPSEKIRERVIKARKIQAERFKDEGIFTNAEMGSKEIKKYCSLDEKTSEFMKTAAAKYGLSGRKFDRILKLARTVADLSGEKDIRMEHITQALQYRVDVI